MKGDKQSRLQNIRGHMFYEANENQKAIQVLSTIGKQKIFIHLQ